MQKNKFSKNSKNLVEENKYNFKAMLNEAQFSTSELSFKVSHSNKTHQVFSENVTYKFESKARLNQSDFVFGSTSKNPNCIKHWKKKKMLLELFVFDLNSPKLKLGEL